MASDELPEAESGGHLEKEKLAQAQIKHTHGTYMTNTTQDFAAQSARKTDIPAACSLQMPGVK
jgi:hypothetical protein